MAKEDEVLTVFNAVRNALMTNNIEVLGELFSEDYRGFNLRGGIDDRDLILKVYQPGQVTLDTYDVEDLKVDVIGNVGIVSGRGYLHGSYGDESWEHRIRFLDIFVNRGKKWLYTISQATEIVGD